MIEDKSVHRSNQLFIEIKQMREKENNQGSSYCFQRLFEDAIGNKNI